MQVIRINFHAPIPPSSLLACFQPPYAIGVHTLNNAHARVAISIPSLLPPRHNFSLHSPIFPLCYQYQPTKRSPPCSTLTNKSSTATAIRASFFTNAVSLSIFAVALLPTRRIFAPSRPTIMPYYIPIQSVMVVLHICAAQSYAHAPHRIAATSCRPHYLLF